MSVTPFVYPNNNDTGICLQPEAYALFDFALEPGVINPTNCFLIKKTIDSLKNTIENVSCVVGNKRISLTDNTEVTITDFGDTLDLGKKYRTKITIKPNVPLDAHAEYSVVLSPEIGTLTVFDVQTTSTSKIEAKGPYTGKITDQYRIEVTQSGDAATTLYKWNRVSDNKIERNLKARGRFIEIDQGVFIKFSGNYTLGDVFLINVKPIDKLNETFAWNFVTGDSSFVTPVDSKSNVILDLPYKQDAIITSSPFTLTNVSPYDGQTMFEPPKNGQTVFNGIGFITKKRTASYNNAKIIFQSGATTAVTASPDKTLFIIEFDDTTTNDDIVQILQDGFDITAFTSMPTKALTTEGEVIIKDGVSAKPMTLEFNKRIDPTSVKKENITVLIESLTDATSSDSLDYEFEVIDNKIIINFV